MKRRALDLFCAAGGATRGLQLAGFEVWGVDIEPQPRYCGHFVQREALEFAHDYANGFDFVWASPPCQRFTAYRRKNPEQIGATYPDLIAPVREALLASGRPFVIENVPGAPLVDPVTLCGSMFGLEVRRHRLFEAHGFAIPRKECEHGLQNGSFPPATNRENPRRTVEVGVWRIPLDVQQRAMGIDWMKLEELSQAIPPAYAEHIGRAALAKLEALARDEEDRRWGWS